ncbi:MFS transporter [Camelliibacillus cellulosilyticus]|uniref:MFS transporter n=1 Tax=Camelliibacillus cellulosilyticus TaxID=2174486 RepID=A0ABV9GKL3_9BACL
MLKKINYLTGAAISNFGDGCQQIAMTWYIYHLTGNAFSIGLMIAIYYVPSIVLTPFLSVLVDARDAKWLTIATDVGRFVFIGLMTVLIFLGVDSVFLLYIMQGFLAVCYTIYKPASQSFIKEAFKSKDLAFVMSKSSSFNELANIVGVGIAGALIAAAPAVYCFLINDLSFLFPIFLFALVKRAQKKAAPQGKLLFFSKLKEGFAFIRTEKDMPYLFYLSILNSVALQMSATMLLPLAQKLGGESQLYATFEMAFSIGGILSGLMLTILLLKWRGRLLIFTMVGMAILSVLIGVVPYKYVQVFLLFLFGFFTFSHMVATQTIIQLRTPIELIGRVIGFRTIIASLVKITSALSTGFLIERLEISNILFLFALIIFLSLLSFKKAKSVEVHLNG